MSFALAAVPVNIASGSFQIPLNVQPERILGLRINNVTPYSIILSDMPGIGQAWLSSNTEDFFPALSSSSGFYNQSKGYITVTVPSSVLNSLPPVNLFFNLLITVYELDDELPTGLPVHHPFFVYTYNAVRERAATFGGSFEQTVAGTGATLTLFGSDATGIPGLILQNFVVLDGYSVEFENPSVITVVEATIAGALGATLNHKMVVVPNQLNSFVRLFKPGWKSTNRGNPANTITFTIPNTVNMPKFNISLWAHLVGLDPEEGL